MQPGILFSIEPADKPASLQQNIAREATLRIPYATGAAITIAGPAFAQGDTSVYGSTSALAFALGVLGGTAVLHLAGVGLSTLLMRHGPALRLLRVGLGLGALSIVLG